MLERTETRFGMKPASLAADSAYGSADSLAWLVKKKQIAPHIPVFDKSNRTDGTFSRVDFKFDPERDRYILASDSGQTIAKQAMSDFFQNCPRDLGRARRRILLGQSPEAAAPAVPPFHGT